MKRFLAALGVGVLGAAACTGSEPQEQTAVASAPVGAAPIEAYFVVLDGPGAAQAIPAGVDPRSPGAAAVTRKRITAIELEQAALQPALDAYGATVIARLSRLANVIQVLTDEQTARRIGELPGVRKVERVELLERSLESAVPVVGAPQVWGGTPGLAGEGITIGIIDSGIDYTHADFAGPGTSEAYEANDPTLIELDSFPTAKVIGGWDFAGDAYNPSSGQQNPDPDPDPLDCATVLGEQISGGHGTHVAGIAAGTGVALDGSSFAGPYDASIYASSFRVGPGVAPRAKLFALKVFGCQGSTTLLASALDRAADPDQDGSFADRLDVVNGSLGSPYGLGTSVVGEMVTALTDVGTLIVAAAGNEGQNFFVTGSPASFPEVLSVAASVDSNLHTLRVTSPAAAVAAYPAAESQFTARLAAVGPIGAPIVTSDPPNGCLPFANAAQMAGGVALIDRGSCTFVEKFANAVAAGAIGAVIIDNESANLPFAMTGTPGTSPIPGFMVTLADGTTLKAACAQGPVTIALDPDDRYTGPGAELLAGFSSRGPSSIDGRLKPEITAPGVSILSAGVGTGSEAVNNQGTSMASPVVAGAAALLRQARPALPPLRVKAMLMNAASPLSDFAGAPYGSGVIGAGRLDIARAVLSPFSAAADPFGGEVGVSFGSIIATESTSVERTFVLSNHGETAATFSPTIDATHTLPGVTISVSPATVELAAGEAATLTLTLALDPAALGNPPADPGTPAIQGNQTPQPRHYLNQASGVVRLAHAGGDDVVLPYTGSVRAAVDRHGVAPSACDAPAAPGEPVAIALEGGGPHPEPVVSVFELGGLDDPDRDAERDPIVAQTDLLAAGLATDLATAASFDEAMVFFAVAVNGPWSTPARGPLSVVKVQVDTDDDIAFDYEIRVEARNPDPPFRDALMASTYNIATGERSGRYPINVLPPDIAKTHPFNSTVLVLPANLDELGVDEDAPVFEWQVATERPDLLINSDKIKGTYDASKPILSAGAHGVKGAPVFIGAAPILVDVSAEARAAGSPLNALLLHHTNAPGQQWEVVSLVQGSAGNLTLSASGPAAAIKEAETAQVSLTVGNGGASPAPGVSVSGSANQGQVVAVTTPQGSCAAGATIDCALGELAPGASVELTVTVKPALPAASTGEPQITLSATVTSELPCESQADDNAANLAFGVIPTPPVVEDPLEPTGGCACRAGGEPRGGAQASWLLAALGLLAARHASRAARRAGR